MGRSLQTHAVQPNNPLNFCLCLCKSPPFFSRDMPALRRIKTAHLHSFIGTKIYRKERNIQYMLSSSNQVYWPIYCSYFSPLTQFLKYRTLLFYLAANRCIISTTCNKQNQAERREHPSKVINRIWADKMVKSHSHQVTNIHLILLSSYQSSCLLHVPRHAMLIPTSWCKNAQLDSRRSQMPDRWIDAGGKKKIEIKLLTSKLEFEISV